MSDRPAPLRLRCGRFKSNCLSASAQSSFLKASRIVGFDQSRAPAQFQIIRPWRPITKVLGMPLTP